MLMQMTLGRFPYDVVREAFSIYLQTGATMPTPADIIKIIEPPIPEKKWCKVTFLEIKKRKRENAFVSLAEDRYIEDFMRAQITAPEEVKGLIDDTLRQAALEHKQYWNE